LEKYLRIAVNSSQIKRVTKSYSEILTSSDYSTENRLQEVQASKVIDMKEGLKEEEVVYGMVDGGMLQTREIKDSIYCGHLGNYEAFLEKFEPLTDKLDDLEEGFVFIADGASWIWRWIKEAYPKATQILDFYHAVEHLSDFAKVLYKNKLERLEWINKQKMKLLNDKIENIINTIEDIKCSKSVDNERNKLLTYLKNNRHRMLYKTFRDRGLRIGSGAIESAHRTVIQKRMKQSGQRWSIQGAQNIIDLRLLNINQQWSVLTDLIKELERAKFNKVA